MAVSVSCPKHCRLDEHEWIPTRDEVQSALEPKWVQAHHSGYFVKSARMSQTLSSGASISVVTCIVSNPEYDGGGRLD